MSGTRRRSARLTMGPDAGRMGTAPPVSAAAANSFSISCCLTRGRAPSWIPIRSISGLTAASPAISLTVRVRATGDHLDSVVPTAQRIDLVVPAHQHALIDIT